MEYSIDKALEILERTPEVLNVLLLGLSDQWTLNNEGENTWSPFDIVGHLIHGEQTDWIERAQIILSETESKRFESFNRFAQFENSKGKTLHQLLGQFARLRQKNLEKLKAFQLTNDQLTLKGLHPELGEVTLKQLLSCWVVHDLGHIAQTTRVMAKQYKDQVGPWEAYLPVLK